VTKRVRVIVGLLLFAATIPVMLKLDAMNEAARQPHPYAFPDLQNATDEATARTIIESWNKAGVNPQIEAAMRLDLVFPFLYAPLIGFLCWTASLHRPTRWVAWLGRALVIAALVAGVCDLAENATMLSMLGHEQNAGRVVLKSVFTWGKNILVLLSSWYVVLSHLDA
jgi:hypothetical protein